ncbi:hypothetical protein IWX90DRAFT_114912 [Phyllosticta citrichinensis]|uniref:Uncharacterized protein n=1 Tax=Phyllosticta citrichinensis TaxID=1130410 RepID=A0ABR1Y2Z0_9PEZI
MLWDRRARPHLRHHPIPTKLSPLLLLPICWIKFECRAHVALSGFECHRSSAQRSNVGTVYMRTRIGSTNWLQLPDSGLSTSHTNQTHKPQCRSGLRLAKQPDGQPSSQRLSKSSCSRSLIVVAHPCLHTGSVEILIRQHLHSTICLHHARLLGTIHPRTIYPKHLPSPPTIHSRLLPCTAPPVPHPPASGT